MTKRQKKVYLSESAAWYLNRLQTELGLSQSDIIEQAIRNEAEKRGIPYQKTRKEETS